MPFFDLAREVTLLFLPSSISHTGLVSFWEIYIREHISESVSNCGSSCGWLKHSSLFNVPSYLNPTWITNCLINVFICMLNRHLNTPIKNAEHFNIFIVIPQFCISYCHPISVNGNSILLVAQARVILFLFFPQIHFFLMLYIKILKILFALFKSISSIYYISFHSSHL